MKTFNFGRIARNLIFVTHLTPKLYPNLSSPSPSSSSSCAPFRTSTFSPTILVSKLSSLKEENEKYIPKTETFDDDFAKEIDALEEEEIEILKSNKAFFEANRAEKKLKRKQEELEQLGMFLRRRLFSKDNQEPFLQISSRDNQGMKPSSTPQINFEMSTRCAVRRFMRQFCRFPEVYYLSSSASVAKHMPLMKPQGNFNVFTNLKALDHFFNPDMKPLEASYTLQKIKGFHFILSILQSINQGKYSLTINSKTPYCLTFGSNSFSKFIETAISIDFERSILLGDSFSEENLSGIQSYILEQHGSVVSFQIGREKIPFLLAFTTRDHIDEFLYSIFTSVPKEHTAYSLIKEPYVIKKINAKKLVDLYQTENISFVQGIAFNFLPSFKHIEKEYICILLNGNKVQVIRNKQKVPQNQKKNKDEKVDSDKKQEHVETF